MQVDFGTAPKVEIDTWAEGYTVRKATSDPKYGAESQLFVESILWCMTAFLNRPSGPPACLTLSAFLVCRPWRLCQSDPQAC